MNLIDFIPEILRHKSLNEAVEAMANFGIKLHAPQTMEFAQWFNSMDGHIWFIAQNSIRKDSADVFISHFYRDNITHNLELYYRKVDHSLLASNYYVWFLPRSKLDTSALSVCPNGWSVKKSPKVPPDSRFAVWHENAFLVPNHIQWEDFLESDPDATV